MTAEIVGSGAGSPRCLPPTSPFRQEENSNFSPKTPVRGQQKHMSGACFNCKQDGHWARDCPQRRQKTSPLPPNNVSPNCPQQQQQKHYPELLCRCGRPCDVRTSRTDKNPNRDFYICAKPKSEACGTFVWCDEAGKVRRNGTNSPVKPDLQRGDQPQRPECLCKAGPCRVETVKEEGELKGLKYYACHLKKGQGACTHFDFCCTDIPEMNKNYAIDQVHLNYYQTTEEPKSNDVINYGAMKDNHCKTSKEKDPPALLPTPPKVEHEPKHLGSGSPSPPVKRLNFSDGGSPSKRNRVEEWLNDCVETLTFDCYLPDKEKNPEMKTTAMEDGSQTEDVIVCETPPELRKTEYYTEIQTFNCYPSDNQKSAELQKNECGTKNDQFYFPSVKNPSLAEAGRAKPVRCVFCGEEGHEINGCIAVVMT